MLSPQDRKENQYGPFPAKQLVEAHNAGYINDRKILVKEARMRGEFRPMGERVRQTTAHSKQKHTAILSLVPACIRACVRTWAGARASACVFAHGRRLVSLRHSRAVHGHRTRFFDVFCLCMPVRLSPVGLLQTDIVLYLLFFFSYFF